MIPIRPGAAPVTERSDGPPVGEEHVVRSGQRRLPVAHARRFRAVGVPEEGGHPGLVVGHPGVDEIAEALEEEPGVLGEPVDHLARCPAAPILQALRQVPVVDGRHGRDLALQQSLDEPAVEVDALLVGWAAPVRLDAGPGDREPVCLQAERAHHLEVLAPAEVVLAGPVAGLAVRHFPRRPAEAVPDRLAAAILGRRSLDLVGGGGGPPDEIVGKAHPFTAPFMIPLMM